MTEITKSEKNIWEQSIENIILAFLMADSSLKKMCMTCITILLYKYCVISHKASCKL